MPYELKEEDGKHCVYNKDTGERKACHDDKEMAERQIRLLHSLEKEED
jgi:hypothetical protein